MKKKYIISVFLLIFTFIFFIEIDRIRSTAKMHLPNEVKILIKELIFGKQRLEEFKELQEYGLMNYNKKLLPETQFAAINLKKVSLRDLDLRGVKHYNKLFSEIHVSKFFIEKFNDGLVIVDGKGKIFFLDELFINDINNLNWTELNSNLNSKNIYEVLDILVASGEIYISYSSIKSENCNIINISKAKNSKKILNFEVIFKSESCLSDIVGGRMAFYKKENINGLLITTGAAGDEKSLAQDVNSIFGKILFIDLKTKKYEIFSKGHRNPQGLTIVENLILSTEHGPKGGDEINLIQFGHNYGWPIASYGEPYPSEVKKSKIYDYLKSHGEHGFIEPIYSFVPSIGISQIIKVPENFSEYWKNNFLVTSLGATNIYRILFDENFSKLIYHEEIFVGERIRDIYYFEKLNVFLLALENSEGGNIGILSNGSN